METRSGGTVALKDIMGSIDERGTLRIFARALRDAGLDKRLGGAEELTVFAPEDDAFRDMTEDTLTDLFADAEFLANIMKYHLVPGRLTSEGMAGHPAVKTFHGDDVTIKVSDGSVQVDDSKIIEPDIECSNGVIHVIDTILVPKHKVS